MNTQTKLQPVQSDQNLQIELTKKVGEITKPNPNLEFFYNRRSNAFLDLLPKMFLPVKEKLFREHEAKLLKNDMRDIEEDKRIRGEYSLMVLKEIVNTRVENVKSILRNERGVHLVNQLKLMIEEIFIKERDFEAEITRRDTEIDAIPNNYLREKARESWRNKIDVYYEVGSESVQKFRRIIDEELK